MEVEFPLEALSLALNDTMRKEAEKISELTYENVSTYVQFMFEPATLLAVWYFPENIFHPTISADEREQEIAIFKENYFSDLNSIHKITLKDIFAANGGPEQSTINTRTIHNKIELQTFAIMFGSIILEAAFDSIQKCDEALTFLCTKVLQCEKDITFYNVIRWISADIVRHARRVVVDLCNGDFAAAPHPDVFEVNFKNTCHLGLQATFNGGLSPLDISSEFSSLIPVLIRTMVISERNSLNATFSEK